MGAAALVHHPMQRPRPVQRQPMEAGDWARVGEYSGLRSARCGRWLIAGMPSWLRRLGLWLAPGISFPDRAPTVHGRSRIDRTAYAPGVPMLDGFLSPLRKWAGTVNGPLVDGVEHPQRVPLALPTRKCLVRAWVTFELNSNQFTQTPGPNTATDLFESPEPWPPVSPGRTTKEPALHTLVRRV